MVAYSDDFNRPDSTTVTGWTESGDDWSIKSNQLAPGTTTVGTIRYDQQLSTADHYAEIVVATPGGTSMGVFARSDAATGSYYLWRNNGSNWALFYNVSGSFVQIGSSYTAAAVAGDVARVECNGSTITGYVNGVSRVSTTDTHITTGTYVGLRSLQSSTCRYDNFAAADLVDIRTQSGTATISLGASGVRVAERVAAGMATLALSSSGAATVERFATGTGALSLTASGAAVAERSASGTSLLTLAGSGTAEKEATSTGVASLALAGTGAAAREATSAGTAVLSLDSMGTGVAERSAAGTATLVLTAHGVTPADVRDITVTVTPQPSRWTVTPAPSRWTVRGA
jgi:hypothetical protein